MLYFHRQQVFAEETPCTCGLWMQPQDGTPFYAQLKSLARRGGDTGVFHQEQERAALAREIHDEVAQALTGLHMDMTWPAGQLSTKSEAHNRLQTMRTQLHDLDTAVHRMAMTLRPRLLDDLGLLAAIEWQLEDVQQRTGLRCMLWIGSSKALLQWRV
jgi:signal transduction histidine kinase